MKIKQINKIFSCEAPCKKTRIFLLRSNFFWKVKNDIPTAMMHAKTGEILVENKNKGVVKRIIKIKKGTRARKLGCACIFGLAYLLIFFLIEFNGRR